MGYSFKTFALLRLCVRQNGKAERSEKWRTAFTKGQLGIKPGEEIPHYERRLI